MRLFVFTVISLFSLWLILSFGTGAIIGFFVGIIWTLAVISACGIPLKWLNDLMRKIEIQGGSIFTTGSGPQHGDY